MVEQLAFVLGVVGPKQGLGDVGVLCVLGIHLHTLGLAHHPGGQLLDARRKGGAEHHGLAPLDGQIVEVNADLADNPGLINEDPDGRAWFFKMKIKDLSALDSFMTSADYEAFLS